MIKSFNFWKNKRVLILGHTGFKGSWLSYTLKLLGAKIYGYSLKPENKNCLFEKLNLKKSFFVKHVYADILDYKKLQKFILNSKAQIIINLAAQSLVRKSYKFPLETFKINYIGSLNILYAAKDMKSLRSIIMITTDKVYENFEKKGGYKETDRLGGFDPYSASKSSSEIAIKSFANSFLKEKKINLATLRAGNVIGGGDWCVDRLIPDIIKSLKYKKKLILRNPKSIRPWQHVLETVFAYLNVAQAMFYKKFKSPNNWNIGPNKSNNISVLEIIKFFKKNFKNLNFELKKSYLKETKVLTLKNNKFKKDFNWKPVLNKKQTLNFTLTWYKYFLSGNTKELNKLTKSQIHYFLKKNNQTKFIKL